VSAAARGLAGRRPEWIAAAAYAVLFVLTWPPTFAIIDESAYLSSAYTFRAGTVFQDVAGVDSVSRVAADGHEVGKFAPLWPAVLAIFTLPGWSAAFAAGLALHLAGFLVFAALVRRAGAPAWTSLLYLAHPTLVYYSRTMMSDTAAGVAVLLAWSAWRGEGRIAPVRAGLWLGVSCLVRYTNAVLAAIFTAAAVADDLRRRGDRPARSPGLLLGLLPPATALAAYNHVAFGKWWRGAAGYTDDRHGLGMAGQFGWDHVGSGLAHYGAALLALWPLMPLALLALRGRDAFVQRAVALGFTLFFCFYYWRDDAAGLLPTWVVGLRFLAPVLPLYLLAYAEALGRWAPSGARGRRAGALAAAVAVAAAVTVSVRHHGALQERAAERDVLYGVTAAGDRILCDTGARKLLHPAWGDRRAERVEYRGRWELPPAAGVSGAYVAMAGRGRDAEAVAPLREWLASARARELPSTGSARRLRVWRVPPER
jgi:hypothetical protein